MLTDITNLPIGTFLENAKGELTAFNAKYAQTLGLGDTLFSGNKISSLIQSTDAPSNKEEINSTNWRDYLSQPDKNPTLADWKKQCKTGKTIHIICKLKKASGNEIWVDIKANPIYSDNKNLAGYIGTLTDITNQKMFETVLERFKKAVEKTESQIIFTDPKGIILYANEGVEKTTGFSSAELVGTKAGKLWGGLMDKDFYTTLWERISDQKQPFSAELINKKKTGETYYAELNITPVLDATGQIEFFVGIERDITYIKEIDKVKSEFISLASHQLRTPLSSIKWLCELFWQEDVSQLTADQKEVVQKVQNENERLIKLVNSLLNVSRIEAKKINVAPEQTDFNKLVQQTVDSYRRHMSNRGVSLIENYQSELPKLLLDPKLTAEAVGNLVSNAVKYTAQNVQITLTTKREKAEVVLSVSDTGIGIPINDQKHIFDRFFRASNANTTLTDGNGLGLYFVKWVAGEHGGRVWFDSKENSGSTFYLAFPITPKS